ncbi:MAG: L,D-transpeptidase family protein [Candidatus Omnitrophica bacterium]|nr:L,D-transpeptidase family protein [Candidatus Omnitrophota bacterium]
MRKPIIFIIGAICVMFLISSVFILNKQGSKKSIPKGEISSVMEKGAQSFAQGEFLDARNAYKQVLESTQDPQVMEEARGFLEGANMKLLFSPVMDECSTEYVVKPNDMLIKIAKQYGTTVALIQRANTLSSHIIRPQQKLKVNTCPFSIAVDKSQNVLFLKRNGEIFKTYPISTGTNGSTPVGTFKIINKLKNPTWFRTGAVIPPDSPENILGSRWMGFDEKGYGIHGTKAPDKIGEQVTLGCVRMFNHDVEELYDVVPVGTEVVIVE